MSEPKASVQSLLGEYAGKRHLYEELCREVQHLLETLLQQEGIKVHSVTCRAKMAESLEGKLKRQPRKYGRLSDMTDLAGVRIITYFDDDVYKVGELVGREFEIDWDNSADRRELMDPDRFGYLSLHYVVTLGSARSGLAEYARFQSMLIEIQIRSVLQHAWAEIEHDLGYKVKAAIPRDYRRAFARIAGLLETADLAFSALRDGLGRYAEEVAESIEETPEEIGIDRESVLSFLRSNGLARALDETIANSVGRGIEDPGMLYVDSIVRVLRWAGLETIADVEVSLREHREAVIELAVASSGMPWDEVVTRGSCLDAVSAYLSLRRGDDAVKYHVEGWGMEPADAEPYAEALQWAYERLSENKAGPGE